MWWPFPHNASLGRPNQKSKISASDFYKVHPIHWSTTHNRNLHPRQKPIACLTTSCSIENVTRGYGTTTSSKAAAGALSTCAEKACSTTSTGEKGDCYRWIKGFCVWPG